MNPFSLHMIGGCGTFGRNCLVLEQDGFAVMLDCGSQFPSDAACDISAMVPHPENAGRLYPRPNAYILTHGHEDHIGAVAHLLSVAPAPVYGTDFTLALIAERVGKLPVSIRKQAPLISLKSGEKVDLADGFGFTPVTVSHSILQAVAVCLDFPVGRILHTGDFKLSGKPPTDLGLFRDLARQPLFLMLADSTGVCMEEHTPEESFLHPGIHDRLVNAPGRVIVTVFSSHVERIRTFLAIGKTLGRVGAPLGRSMEKYARTAQDLGLLPDSNWTTLEEVSELPPDRQLIFISGSQGEPHSAMDRLSSGQNHRIKLCSTDTVIFSVSTIPGRELPVSMMIDRFLETGARVLWHEEDSPLHVSGHGSSRELKTLLNIFSPQVFVPLHGSMRYLLAARDIAGSCGVPDSFICKNGMRAQFDGDCWQLEHTGCDAVLSLDNPTDRPIDDESIRERRRLGASGVVFASLFRDARGRWIFPPQVSLQGIGTRLEQEELVEECRKILMEAGKDLISGGKNPDLTVLEMAVRRFFKTKTGKKPQVMLHLHDQVR